ncbi:MAG: GIY-YIG nuclease family protein [Maricaulaceae bacterium]
MTAITKKQWGVYIVRCADDTLYTGITNNLENRLAVHNKGTGAKYTKTRRPVTKLYWEICEDRSAASKREYAIKSLNRQAKLVLIKTG